MKNEIRKSAHSTYRCQYHIVFAPKYRRKAIYGQIKADIGQILRKLCEQKGVEIIEANAMPDHIHMLVSVPPYLSIAQFMGYLKGKSTLMIFDRHANLKYKLRKPALLVQRVLCGYSGKKREPNCGVCEEPTKRR
jgi:putative transposase